MNTPPQDQQQEVPPEERERLSWAGYLGAATGLAGGITAAELGAAMLLVWFPGSMAAEVFWEVGAPLLAILGVVVGSFGFHRWFRDRVWVPALVFLAVLTLAVVVAMHWVGFPWRDIGPV